MRNFKHNLLSSKLPSQLHQVTIYTQENENKETYIHSATQGNHVDIHTKTISHLHHDGKGHHFHTDLVNIHHQLLYFEKENRK